MVLAAQLASIQISHLKSHMSLVMGVMSVESVKVMVQRVWGATALRILD
jgi:hypothetical protein